MSNPNPSPLDSLSESQKQQLLCWLDSTSLRKVAALVAKDPPEGFGIRTHTTTLHRYHARHRAQDRAEDIDLARLFATNRPAGSADQGSASLTDSPIMDSATVR